MPCTTYGTWDDGKRTVDCEEAGGENGGETCILHAYLDRDGAILGRREMEEFANTIAEDITDGVMTEHDSEDTEEEHDAFLKELVVNGCNNTANDAGKSENAECRHNRLRLLE